MSNEACNGYVCLRRPNKKGFCEKHYKRLRKGHDPTTPSLQDDRTAIICEDYAKIPLGVGAKQGYAIVDKHLAYLSEYKWTLGSHGYAVRDPKKAPSLMHHIVLTAPPKDKMIDHIDRNKLNNRLSNLRLVDATVNIINTPVRSNNKSGHKGVSWDSGRETWRVTIAAYGKRVNRYRKNKQEAIILRKELEAIYHAQ